MTDPWAFFNDYAVELSDEDTARFTADDVAVWVTVRAGSELSDFSVNLRAPILVSEGEGHQVINEATHAPVRAPLHGRFAQREDPGQRGSRRLRRRSRRPSGRRASTSRHEAFQGGIFTCS